MRSFLLFIALFFIIPLGLSSQLTDQEIEKKVIELLNRMTLIEKVGQMNQYNGFWDVTGPIPEGGDSEKKYENLRTGLVGSMLNVRGVDQVRKIQEIAVKETRLGIPIIFGFDVIHGFKTQAPVPLAEAASWDMEAIQESARIAATEAAAAGLNWTFAPMVDISRDPRWGRVMEGAGEDPFLASKIAYARVKGFQGEDLSATNTIAACAKHFASYGFVEAGREYNTVDMSENLLRNVVLPPFKACVDAGVATFMNAFNELNGVPATGNTYLLRKILKDEWNYQGFVVSDWASISEMVTHGYAEDLKEAAAIAANAGSDLDMESYAYLNHLESLVTSGVVKEEVIEDAVKRILRIKFKLGLFDDPFKYCNNQREQEVMYSPRHRATVLDMAKKSMVLLKNETKLLPLKKAGQKIALIGPLADAKNSPLGSWRLASDDNTAVSVLEGLSTYSGNEILYTEGVKLVEEEPVFIIEAKVNKTSTSGIAQAVNIAREADVVVMVLGEHGYMSGEARSRVNLNLPGLQQQLMEAVFEVNPNIVLVMMSGRPLTINWAAENVPTIIQAWQLGTESGNAIADVLMGAYNPSGKLPMTFPRDVGQIPVYYNHKMTGRPVESSGIPGFVFWSHYGDIENTPLFPFGYGLSYTDFEYSNLVVIPNQNGAQVSVTVTNTGSLDGEEVVQLYIRDKVASITRPIKELKGFDKISLASGSSKTVHFDLTQEHLGYYNNQGEYLVEPGDFDIMVGGNSVDLLKQTVRLENIRFK